MQSFVRMTLMRVEIVSLLGTVKNGGVHNGGLGPCMLNTVLTKACP